MVRVVLADSHPVVRKGMEQLLEREPGIRVLGAVSNLSEAIATTQELRPDVLILDVDMPCEPGSSTSDLNAQLNSCGAKILGISLANDDADRSLATSIGAAEL